MKNQTHSQVLSQEKRFNENLLVTNFLTLAQDFADKIKKSNYDDFGIIANQLAHTTCKNFNVEPAMYVPSELKKGNTIFYVDIVKHKILEKYVMLLS